MRTILKAAISLDGCFGTAEGPRHIFSNELDRLEVLKLRAEVDAVLIGGNTLRLDEPKLSASGASPKRVVLSSSGNLAPQAAFFREDAVEVFVYTTKKAQLAAEIESRARVKRLGHTSQPDPQLDLSLVLEDLEEAGINSLLIEAGPSLAAQFIEAGLVREFRFAIAAYCLGQGPELSLKSPAQLKINSVRQLSDLCVLRGEFL